MRARDYRTQARAALKGYWLLSVGITFVAGLLGGSVGGTNGLAFSGGSSAGSGATASYQHSISLPPYITRVFAFFAGLSFIYLLVVFIFGGAITLGLRKYNIDLVGRGQSPAFSTLFSRFSYFGKALLLQLVSAFFIFLWSLLFIIPGIIAAYRYSMASYIMAQNPDIGVMEAISRSKEMMRGHKWQLFCLQLSFIGWAFLCLFSFGIGYLWLMPYQNAAEAAFYLNLSHQPMPQPNIGPAGPPLPAPQPPPSV